MLDNVEFAVSCSKKTSRRKSRCRRGLLVYAEG